MKSIAISYAIGLMVALPCTTWGFVQQQYAAVNAMKASIKRGDIEVANLYADLQNFLQKNKISAGDIAKISDLKDLDKLVKDTYLKSGAVVNPNVSSILTAAAQGQSEKQVFTIPVPPAPKRLPLKLEPKKERTDEPGTKPITPSIREVYQNFLNGRYKYLATDFIPAIEKITGRNKYDEYLEKEMTSSDAANALYWIQKLWIGLNKFYDEIFDKNDKPRLKIDENLARSISTKIEEQQQMIKENLTDQAAKSLYLTAYGTHLVKHLEGFIKEVGSVPFKKEAGKPVEKKEQELTAEENNKVQSQLESINKLYQDFLQGNIKNIDQFKEGLYNIFDGDEWRKFSEHYSAVADLAALYGWWDTLIKLQKDVSNELKTDNVPTEKIKKELEKQNVYEKKHEWDSKGILKALDKTECKQIYDYLKQIVDLNGDIKKIKQISAPPMGEKAASQSAKINIESPSLKDAIAVAYNLLKSDINYEYNTLDKALSIITRSLKYPTNIDENGYLKEGTLGEGNSGVAQFNDLNRIRRIWGMIRNLATLKKPVTREQQGRLDEITKFLKMVKDDSLLVALIHNTQFVNDYNKLGIPEDADEFLKIKYNVSRVEDRIYQLQKVYGHITLDNFEYELSAIRQGINQLGTEGQKISENVHDIYNVLYETYQQNLTKQKAGEKITTEAAVESAKSQIMTDDEVRATLQKTLEFLKDVQKNQKKAWVKNEADSYITFVNSLEKKIKLKNVNDGQLIQDIGIVIGNLTTFKPVEKATSKKLAEGEAEETANDKNFDALKETLLTEIKRVKDIFVNNKSFVTISGQEVPIAESINDVKDFVQQYTEMVKIASEGVQSKTFKQYKKKYQDGLLAVRGAYIDYNSTVKIALAKVLRNTEDHVQWQKVSGLNRTYETALEVDKEWLAMQDKVDAILKENEANKQEIEFKKILAIELQDGNSLLDRLDILMFRFELDIEDGMKSIANSTMIEPDTLRKINIVPCYNTLRAILDILKNEKMVQTNLYATAESNFNSMITSFKRYLKIYIERMAEISDLPNLAKSVRGSSAEDYDAISIVLPRGNTSNLSAMLNAFFDLGIYDKNDYDSQCIEFALLRNFAYICAALDSILFTVYTRNSTEGKIWQWIAYLLRSSAINGRNKMFESYERLLNTTVTDIYTVAQLYNHLFAKYLKGSRTSDKGTLIEKNLFNIAKETLIVGGKSEYILPRNSSFFPNGEYAYALPSGYAVTFNIYGSSNKIVIAQPITGDHLMSSHAFGKIIDNFIESVRSALDIGDIDKKIIESNMADAPNDVKEKVEELKKQETALKFKLKK